LSCVRVTVIAPSDTCSPLLLDRFFKSDASVRGEGAVGLLLNATSVAGAFFVLKDVGEFEDSTGHSAVV